MMKECPACDSELPDDALTCRIRGGSYQPDGSFKTPWDVDMARLAVERERKVESAKRFGRLGKPIPHLFLESKSGCLVGVVIGTIALTLITGGLALALS